MGPGEILAGRFELRGRIGSGGLAEVFAAHDRVSRTDVAIKILHAHLLEDRGVADRFRREMAVTRRLDHPNIVRVFDLHEHEGRPFFSMELLQGQTLEVVLKEGPVSAQEARRLAREICSALVAAHRTRVIHRDLKPANVFVTTARAVKLLDFGLARVAGQSRRTSKTAVMGSAGYIAPELFLGQPADGRADLYSLGVTYYEMLAGKRPFADSDPYEVNLVKREPPRFDARIRAEDVAILRRALDSDPEQRFLDASQMLRALTGESVPQPPATPPMMTAGEYDVLVHNVVRPLEIVQARPPIVKVLDQLGAVAAPQWRWRLLGAGQAVLVRGASRRTAEAAAAVCAEHGLPATVRPVSLRPRSEEWLARNGSWLLAMLCAVGAWLVAMVLDASTLWIPAGIVGGYVLSWGLRPPASKAPLAGLPRQDSSVGRLADGIARRAELLRRRRNGLSEPHREAIDRLLRVAEVAVRRAREGSEAPPDSGQALQADVLTSSLLEIAAALDDALVAVEDLPRLQQDAELAEQALRTNE